MKVSATTTEQKERKGNTMLNSEMLRKAADLADEIAAKQNELNQLLAGQPVEVSATSASTRTVTTASGRKFTPEAIEKIRAAQRRRWKAVRKAKNAAVAATQAPAAPAVADAPATPTVVPAPTPAPAPAPAPAAQNQKRGQLVAA